MSDPDLYRLQPFDTDLEQALLGTLLIDHVWLPIVGPELLDTDFYDPLHQRIYAAMQAMAERESAVTPLTVGAELATDKGLAEVGGRPYLISLSRAAPAAANVREHAAILRGLALRRQALTACENAADALASTSIPVTTSLRGVLEVADEAAALARPHRRVTLFQDALNMAQEIEDIANGKAKVDAVPSGLDRLDAQTGGFQAGDFVIIAGRPGMGKSALMSTIALRAAQARRPALYVSLEMTQRQLTRRFTTAIDYDIRRGDEAAMQYSKLRGSRVTLDDVERVARAAQYLDGLPIEFAFADEIKSAHDIAARARAFIAQQDRMGIILVDYMQKVPASGRYAGNRVNEVTETSGVLMRIAKGSEWPVVVGSQLSRQTENRDNQQPQLSDLRESGAIEQDADMVFGLYRMAYYLQQRRPGPTAPAAEQAQWEGEYSGCRHTLDVLLLKLREGEGRPVELFCDMGASAILDEKPTNQSDITGLL